MITPPSGLFAEGPFAVGNFAVGYFSVKKFRRGTLCRKDFFAVRTLSRWYISSHITVRTSCRATFCAESIGAEKFWRQDVLASRLFDADVLAQDFSTSKRFGAGTS